MTLSRNIILACGHDEALAQLAQNELTAWCYLCADRVEVTKTEDSTGDRL
jgi:hypothetical protein